MPKGLLSHHANRAYNYQILDAIVRATLIMASHRVDLAMLSCHARMLRHVCRLERSAVLTDSSIAPLGVVTHSLAGMLADTFALWFSSVDNKTIEDSIVRSATLPTVC